MKPSLEIIESGANIAAVERDTGLPKDTLRAWERRYGFPAPRRDAAGQRIYSTDDIRRLRLIKRLVDSGYRPGKILPLPEPRLRMMAEGLVITTATSPMGADIDVFLELVTTHRVEELRRQLGQALLRLGLAQFVATVIAPLNARIGDAWAGGKLEIFEEHLYTEIALGMLRNAISSIPRPGVDPPMVLLTTFPREPHGLGLLMAEAFFALEGCRCLSLGVQTPIADIVRAAQRQKSDIVALSFSNAANASQSLNGLIELRAQLPPRTELWVGGGCPVLERKTFEGMVRLRKLTEVGAELTRWRRRRRSAE